MTTFQILERFDGDGDYTWNIYQLLMSSSDLIRLSALHGLMVLIIESHMPTYNFGAHALRVPLNATMIMSHQREEKESIWRGGEQR